MKKHILLISLLAVFTGAYAQQLKSSRPNIIIIMADDLGYSDLGCYGGEINTPNLDRLARNGLRMTNFYNNARCCPTRASLLTGQYAHKVGLANNGNALTRNGATIAELLRSNGYQTGMTGKWHLSDDVQQPSKEDQLKWLNHQAYQDKPFASLQSYPINRGFQKHYGIIWGVVDHFDPFSLVDGERNVETVPPDYNITDAIDEKTIEYVKEFTSRRQPYFLYVAHTAPHWPIQAKPEDIERYKNRYRNGWDELRKERYARMVKMGLIDAETTPLLNVMGQSDTRWDLLSDIEKEKQAMKMAVHAAMISRLDKSVGNLISTLRKTKTFNNTLILFLADNGASPEIPSAPGYDRPSETRDGRKLQYDAEVQTQAIGKEISYTGIGSYWANAANTPFRFWKMESYEGGIHTPMIVHWPNGLKTKSGSLNGTLGHVTDILPTIMELTGSKYPAAYNGNPLTPMDGYSFFPLLQGKPFRGRSELFFEHASGKAYIKDDWKLVQQTGKNNWDLYKISTDRNESSNVAGQHPDKVAEMKTAWEKWFATMKPYIKPRPGSGPQ